MSARVACANCTGPCTGVRRDERHRAVCKRCPCVTARAVVPPGAWLPRGAAYDGLRALLAKHTAAAIVARERGAP